MLKPWKPYLRWLPVAAGMLVVAALLVILISGPEPAQRNAGTAAAPAPMGAEPERALVAPGDMPPIVFASNRPGAYQLFATRPAGGQLVQVTDEPAMYPSWSPDGTRLVFVGEADQAPEAEPGEHEHGDDHAEAASTGRRMDLNLVRSDATIIPLITGPQVPSHPTVRRDGVVSYQSTLLDVSEAAGLNGRSSIDTVHMGRRQRRTIIENRGAAYQPAWSPDGSRLAIILGNPSCESERLCRQRLVVWNPEEDARQTLIGRGSAAAPAWSPDGESIAFTWDRGEGPAIWTVRVGDGRLRQLTSGSPADAEPTWSPDGRRVAFMRDCDIFLQRVDERRARNLTRSRDSCEISPAWRPSSTR